MLSNYKNLIIIGNGFDLNLGYITSFKGFVIFCMYFDRVSLFNKKDCDEILVMFKEMIKNSYLINYYIAIISDLNSEDELDKQKWKWEDVENNLLDLCQAFCGDKDDTKLQYLNYYKKIRKLSDNILIDEFVDTLKKDIDDFKLAFGIFSY